MKEPTHGYVGYDSEGTPIMLSVDDGSVANAEWIGDLIAAGGHVERLTIEAVRQVRLYERPGAP